ncbi:hypothetical protein PILCRDRAFT_14247 [Piloderma croceum F 1598]|uniref:Integrase catalytic domain-containing protein n=1 Tax=Piloderma croceum (strain F 1598) TaxID=765440 RepID=A0A0C3BBJ7_PILCF|nr:hypothetical protein PILCRDRAFT_14247 [Piloderma croceum F 1598]
MADGGSHFDCNESPWLNGLLEGSNGILLNALKRLCAPGLGEDEYEQMTVKDIPNNWPDHLDAAIKHLNDRILPSLKYSLNELLLGLQHLGGYAATVDHAVKRKAAFDARLRKRTPKVVVFQPGDLVQVHATEWVHTFAAIKKLIPMWSIPHSVVTRQLNSYTLEMLGGLPLAGVYNSRRLRTFKPREGTKLAMEELICMEAHEGDGIKPEDWVVGGGVASGDTVGGKTVP